MSDRPHISLWLRRLILTRQDNRCAKCKAILAEPEFHHLVPFSLTQDNSPENLQAVCSACHRAITHGRGVASNRALAKSKRLAAQQEAWEAGQDLKRPGERRRRKGTIQSRGFEK